MIKIPTRLANMIMELRLLPVDLLRQKECTEILNDYITSFRCPLFPLSSSLLLPPTTGTL
jgi:hypothetical protein